MEARLAGYPVLHSHQPEHKATNLVNLKTDLPIRQKRCDLIRIKRIWMDVDLRHTPRVYANADSCLRKYG